jgi:uncharacterized membrane protein
VSPFDHSVVHVALGDAGYMVGNTFLAFVAVLLAWTIGVGVAPEDRPHDRRARWAAWTLILAGGVIGLIRARHLGAEAGMLGVVLIMAGAFVWALLALRGVAWARWLGLLGIVAFTPNAPYVLTDLYHFQQDVRSTGMHLHSNLLSAVMYGTFVVVAFAAWVLLLELARGSMRRHRPTWSWPLVLTITSLVCAFGVYLGRIERFHSWHPLKEPRYFLERVGTALTSTGPIVFTLVIAVVIGLTGALGLRLLDRARRHGSRARQLLAPLALLLSAGLLAGSTMVGRIYDAYGVVTPHPSQRVVVASVVISIVAGAIGGARLAAVTGLGRERLDRYPGHGRQWSKLPLVGLLVGVLVPVLGIGVVWAASGMWWAQHRGLCEYAPAGVELHGDFCYG